MIGTSTGVDGLAVLGEEVLQLSRIEGVFGRKCKIRDCAPISSSEQVLGEMAHRIGFIMALEEASLEHREIDNVAGFSVELERVDDGKGTKRQDLELECEGGAERHRCEKAAMDGIGPVVETMAQNWSSMDREAQHERRVCHQRTSAQLGRTCCQNGPLGDLREGLEVSGTCVVEMATTPLERSGEGQNGLVRTQNDSIFTDGRTWCRRRSPILLEMQMALRNHLGCSL